MVFFHPVGRGLVRAQPTLPPSPPPALRSSPGPGAGERMAHCRANRSFFCPAAHWCPRPHSRHPPAQSPAHCPLLSPILSRFGLSPRGSPPAPSTRRSPVLRLFPPLLPANPVHFQQRSHHRFPSVRLPRAAQSNQRISAGCAPAALKADHQRHRLLQPTSPFPPLGRLRPRPFPPETATNSLPEKVPQTQPTPNPLSQSQAVPTAHSARRPMSQVPESGGTSQDAATSAASVDSQTPTANQRNTAPSSASAPSTAVKHKNHSGSGGLDPRPGGSASSAGPTDDAESQATTTNDHTVDESGDSESGGHNEPGKMFVGGLSWQTSAEGLRDYFCKFGEVNECMVMRDPTTKRARGFGFITFVDPAAVEKVLAVECHELDGKRIDPKIAFPKKQQPKMVIKTKKVFIGGLSSSSTLEDIKTYFSQYGKIEDAMLMFDRSTQRHRGFGFITFDDDEVSDKVCEIHFHEINGKMVECKKAQPKEVMLPLQLNKTRAAAARNLYGLAPEQLLAYASYIPRLPAAAYGPPTAAAHHHGMALAAYPGGVTATAIPSAAMAAPHHFAAGNGHFHQAVAGSGHGGPFALANAHSAGGARGGHQMSNNGAGAGLNPRDLAAAQLMAQQQAVYEAAMIYSQMAAQSADAFAAHAHQHAHHHQHGHAPMHQQQQHQQQPQTPIAQYQSVAMPSTALHSAGAITAQPAAAQPQQFGKP